ncbi:HlyD family efflux transporter periplasmic adaptor subunit [Actinoplanes sp. NPDC051411]|uniref:efflux RND transporter periplasmic adaptor subunit n=1 Tax=Actinoplanes sp. NPDC051411 TaxID=3155522 RepID=UPI0034412CEB
MPARLNLRRPSTAVNAVLVVALVAGAFWAYETISGPDTTSAANASARTVPVRTGTVTKTVTADGSVASATTASASFVTGGTVTEIDVHVGQVVKKGQVLAKVDPAASERSLDAARADLDAANDSLSRAQDADSDTSTAENAVEQAQLEVDQAQAAVDGCTLKAPMAGTITAVNGTIGSSSSGTGSSSSSSSSSRSGSSSGGGSTGGGSTGAGGTSGGSSNSSSSSSSSSSSGFIEIDDLAKLEVTAAFAEADATKLKEKQTATVTWNALSNTSEPAKVSAIDPSATTSNNVVTYGVTLSLDKIPAGAKVGQTVSVSVTTGTVDNALMVSSAAITSVGNRHTVTVVSNGTQQLTPVEVGLVGDSDTQITSGVQEGAQLLINTASTGTSTGGGGFGGAGGIGGAGGLGGAARGGAAGFGGARTTGGGR